MYITKAQSIEIVRQVAELADVASLRDIDLAQHVLSNVASALGIKDSTAVSTTAAAVMSY